MKELQRVDVRKNTGYRLKYISERDMYQIHSDKNGAFEGPLRLIWQKMNLEYDIANADIRYALEEMAKKQHRVANFGIFGTFLCTQKN